MTLKKWICAVLLCIILITLCPIGVFAAGKIDTERDVAFSIVYKDGNTLISNARFDVYKVADVDEYSRLTLTADFDKFKYGITGLENLGEEKNPDWTTIASTLSYYVKKNPPEMTAYSTTSYDGKLEITLKPGLYLVIGRSSIMYQHFGYEATPFLVFLPGLDAVNNDWNYSVSVSPKFSKTFYDPEYFNRFVVRKVVKVWDDEGFGDARPKDIYIQLLRNDEVFTTVKLNAENNWRYTWDHLSGVYNWSVVELPVDGYSAAIERDGVTYVVTNTVLSKPEEEITDEPEVPDEPEPEVPDETETGIHDEPEQDTHGEPEHEIHDELPQTGMLWWPVPVLLILGTALIAAGTAVRRRGKQN